MKGILPILPHAAVKALADFLGATVFAFDVQGRRIALANLEAAFGERYTEAERERVAERSYRNFALTMLELFWGQGISRSRFDAITEVSGFREILEEAARTGRGVALLCPHFAAWEWAAVTFAQIGGAASIVAQDFKNPLLTPLFAELRRHGKHTLLSQERAMLKLLKCVRRGERVAILPDLNLKPEEGAQMIRVFGPDPLEVCVTPLHALLGLRGNALLVPVVADRLGDGRIQILALAPLEFGAETPAEEIVQRTWDVYEPLIREKPELWLWAYKHFRFRPEKTTRPYPFYARPHSGFESLRKRNFGEARAGEAPSR